MMKSRYFLIKCPKKKGMIYVIHLKDIFSRRRLNCPIFLYLWNRIKIVYRKYEGAGGYVDVGYYNRILEGQNVHFEMNGFSNTFVDSWELFGENREGWEVIRSLLVFWHVNHFRFSN